MARKNKKETLVIPDDTQDQPAEEPQEVSDTDPTTTAEPKPGEESVTDEERERAPQVTEADEDRSYTNPGLDTRFVAVNQGEPVWLAKSLYDIRMKGEDTFGRMSLTEITSPPNNQIAPPHQHLEGDELIYVLEGVLKVMVYDGYDDIPDGAEESLPEDEFRTYIVGTGEFIWMPARTVEAIYTLEHQTKGLFIFAPAGGSDEFFKAAGQPATRRTVAPEGYINPDVERLRTLSAETGFQNVPNSFATEDK